MTSSHQTKCMNIGFIKDLTRWHHR